MDWTKEPPKKSELSSGDWMSAPPTEMELQAPSPIERSDKNTGKSSALRGAAQGATFGFADEISGAAEALWEKAKGDPALFGRLYEKYRDESRAEFKRAKEENPKSFLAGEVTGAIGTALVPGLGGASAAKLAGIGAATGLGNSEAEDVEGIAIDTAIGGAAGLALGKAGEYAGKALTKVGHKVGEKTGEWANKAAARALGAERGTIKKIGQDRVMDAGEYALKNKLLSPLTNVDDIITKNESAKAGAMAARKAAYDKIDDAGASTFNPLEVATEVEKKVLGGKNLAYDDVKELSKVLEPQLSNILSRGDGNISMATAQELVESLGKKAKFDASRSTVQNQVAKDVYHIVRDAINKSASEGSEKVKVSGIKSAIEGANKQYSLGKVAGDLLKNKQAREQGNNFIGLTDIITGSGALGYGGMTGDWETAAALVVAKKTLQKYGAQNAALGLDKISKILLKSPQLADLANRNPIAFRAVVQSATGKSSMSEAFSKVAGNDKPKEPRGEAKWIRDGYRKIEEHAKNSGSIIPKSEELLNNPKAKKLLMSASDLKPGSKAMNQIYEELNKLKPQGEE